MTTRPMIRHGIFGIAEHDVPVMGVAGAAVWPVIESGRTRLGGPALRVLRRHLTWMRMMRHATQCETLELVDPPSWARSRIERRRRQLGLVV